MDNQWIRNLAATYGQVKQKQMEEAAANPVEETVDESSVAATRKALAKVSAASKKGIEKVTLPKAPWDKKGKTEEVDEATAKKEDASNDKSDDGEGLDKADPKAAKKKFKDRKDKDIDNDGDTDSSDEYLHKRRKAIAKSMDEEREECPKCEGKGCEHCDNKGYHEVSEAKNKAPKITKSVADVSVKGIAKRANNMARTGKNEDTDSATLVCKECGDTFNKPVSEDCSYDSGDKDGSNWITKSNTDESVQEAAKPESNDITRDSWQKQLQTRKGEADFINKHTIETPEYADGPTVNTKTFQSFLNGVKGPTMRPGDNSAGDKTVVNPPKK